MGVLKQLKLQMWDFPGGLVVENPPSNAGDAGLISSQGTRIPRAMGQLSPCATTTEPMLSRAHAPQLERSRCAVRKDQRRSCVLQRRPDAAKNK